MKVEERLAIALEEITGGFADEPPAWPPTRLTPVRSLDRPRRPLLLPLVGVAAALVVLIAAAVARDAEPQTSTPATSADLAASGPVVLGGPPMVWPAENVGVEQSSAEAVATAFARSVLGIADPELTGHETGSARLGFIDAARLTIDTADAQIRLEMGRRELGWFVTEVGVDRPMPSFDKTMGGTLTFDPPEGTASIILVANVNGVPIQRPLTASELSSLTVSFDGVVPTYLLVYLNETAHLLGAQGSSDQAELPTTVSLPPISSTVP